ncbi:unnamed protein product [Rotaria sordida]|uniref:N-acylglucosamine 2-epimerase n=1 Tax=Rotaria sordida TaxID=392033 RepID=A0A819K0H9_9BILA|nr:unnamed protein product [Rotaria sordida]CAF3941202.1 unnamed protein product [Rotaria sordida]
MKYGRDEENGGLIYGYDLEGNFWKYFVDHKYGGWYRILTPTNEKCSDEKSPTGKTDYHTMGVCYEVLNVIHKE